MSTKLILETLSTHAFASMVGQFSVATFKDPKVGLISFAFIGGLVMPYNAFLATLTSRLFGVAPWVGVEWDSPNHMSLMLSLWAKMKLPQSIYARLERGDDADRILFDLFGAMLITRCQDKDDDERQRLLIQMLHMIEHAYAESLENPIEVENTVALFAPIDPPWGMPSALPKVEDTY